MASSFEFLIFRNREEVAGLGQKWCGHRFDSVRANPSLNHRITTRLRNSVSSVNPL